MLLSTSDVAKRLNVTTARVRQFRTQQLLTPSQIVGNGQALYDPRAVDSFAAIPRPKGRKPGKRQVIHKKKTTRLKK